MSFLSKIGMADDLPDHPKQAVKVPVPAFPAAAIRPPMIASFSQQVTSTANDDVYQQVKASTDFDQSEVGKTIIKFRESLNALPLTEDLKLKTAITLAKANGGLSDDAIRHSFTAIKESLQSLKADFDTKAQGYVAEKINARSQRITEITDQIGKLQVELAELTTKLSEAQGKSASRNAQFAAAVQRRSEELDQQQAQFEALLQG